MYISSIYKNGNKRYYQNSLDFNGRKQRFQRFLGTSGKGVATKLHMYYHYVIKYKKRIPFIEKHDNLSQKIINFLTTKEFLLYFHSPSLYSFCYPTYSSYRHRFYYFDSYWTTQGIYTSLIISKTVDNCQFIMCI